MVRNYFLVIFSGSGRAEKLSWERRWRAAGCEGDERSKSFCSGLPFPALAETKPFPPVTAEGGNLVFGGDGADRAGGVRGAEPRGFEAEQGPRLCSGGTGVPPQRGPSAEGSSASPDGLYAPVPSHSPRPGTGSALPSTTRLPVWFWGVPPGSGSYPGSECPPSF